MKHVVTLVVLLVALGCSAEAPKTIKLSTNERNQAQSIADAREKLVLRRLQAQSEFQKLMNDINSEESALNVKSQKLVLDVQRKYSIDPEVPYMLYERRGVLEQRK